MIEKRWKSISTFPQETSCSSNKEGFPFEYIHNPNSTLCSIVNATIWRQNGSSGIQESCSRIRIHQNGSFCERWWNRYWNPVGFNDVSFTLAIHQTVGVLLWQAWGVIILVITQQSDSPFLRNDDGRTKRHSPHHFQEKSKWLPEEKMRNQNHTRDNLQLGGCWLWSWKVFFLANYLL